MAKKIYVLGNYLYIDDTVTGARISGGKSSFEFVTHSESSDVFTVTQNKQGRGVIALSEMVKFDGVTPF